MGAGHWEHATLTSTTKTRSAKPLPTHALCLCGAEGTRYITEPGGIVSVSAGNGGGAPAPAQKPSGFQRDGYRGDYLCRLGSFMLLSGSICSFYDHYRAWGQAQVLAEGLSPKEK